MQLGQLCERCYKEAKSMRYRKPILRMMKVEAAHSDDERPAGGDARKNRGLLVHTKEGRNPIITAFVYEQDRKIAKRQERSPTKKRYIPIFYDISLLLSVFREPETRTLANPPTSSALSRILPVGVPIDFWTPKFYNDELDLHEKAMYINTGVAFPLPDFCTSNEHHDDWAQMKAKDFMEKYGNDVLAQYNIPTAEELAGHPSESADNGEDDSDDEEETDLEDTEEDDEMEG
jgi:hypothetical protein